MSAPSSTLFDQAFRRLVVAQVVANGPPAVVVALFLVAFLDTDQEWVVRNGVALAIYGVVGFVVLVGLGRVHLPRELAWLREGRAPTGHERDRVLLAPLGGAAGAAGAWIGGAVLFTLLNLPRGADVAWITGGTILLGGASSSALVYLAFERILRPVFALALAGSPPAQPRGPGVVARFSVTWVLTSAIPALTVLALAAAALLGADLSREQLALGAGFFAAGVLIAGLLAMLIAARAVAEPVGAMRDALARVQKGDFAARIPIEDGSEVGLLQAGFNRMTESLGTYLDPAVAGHVLREGASMTGEEIEITALFLDVRDFTGFAAEQTTAAEVVTTLNALFERVVPVVHAHGGHVDKFVGDGLLAVFGAPRRDPEHARHGVAAAREIAAAELPLPIGIGLNSGTVIAGNVGGAGRLEFSVIGDAVNVAARVEAATRGTGDLVLVSERTRELAGGEDWDPRPPLQLGGRAVGVYALPPL